MDPAYDKLLARKRRDEDEKNLALAAGTGVTAGRAAHHSVGALLKDLEEEGVPRTQSYADFQKQLQPGDIMFTRYKPKESPPIELLDGAKLPITASETVQFGTGSPYYHGVLYGGKGMVHQAQGQLSKFGPNRMKSDIMGQDVKVYRPTGASAAERKAALAFLEKARGAPYTGAGETALQGIGNFLGFSPPSVSGKCKPGAINCTTAVTGAYPKQFPDKWMTPDEMREVKGMKLVARYGHIPKPGLYENALTRGVYPLIKNLKHGAATALLGYGAMKAHDYLTGEDA